MKRTRPTLWSNRSKLDANRMPCFFKMLQSVAIPADPTELLTAAAERATSLTEPKIAGEITLGAMCEARRGDISCRDLLQRERMLARQELLFPSFYFRLAS